MGLSGNGFGGGNLAGTVIALGEDVEAVADDLASAVTDLEGQIDAAAGGVVVWARAPNTDVDIASITDVTLFSQSLTGLSVGDTIIVEAWITILNNSAAARTWTYSCDLGAFTFEMGDGTTQAAAAAARSFVKLECKYSISATNLTRLTYSLFRMIPATTDSGNGGITDRYAWSSNTGNLTGTQTLTVQIRSNSATTTQTATVESWRITRQPQTA